MTAKTGKKILLFFLALCLIATGGLMGMSIGKRNTTASAAPSSPLYDAPDILLEKEEMDEVIERAGRTWQGGAPGIARTKGGRLFACLFSGGDNEPQPQNYAIFMYSDDDGETWVDPFLIVDHPDEQTRITDPSVQVDSLGRLWINWNQHYPVPGSSAYGWWSIRIDDPDAPIEEVKQTIRETAPVRNYDGVRINKFIERKNGEWYQPIAVGVINGQSIGGQYIFFLGSTDQGDTWQLRGSVYGGGSWVGEPCVAEKDDGTLWLLTRYGYATAAPINGGVGQSFSDDGKNWTEMEGNLEAPLRGVSSRLYFGRLKSGAYIFITNAHETLRRDLTVYLSYDEGKTWPYSLLLDSRDGADSGYMSGAAYPDCEEDEEGNIYVVWDFGRYNEKEMRMAVFTEEDVKAGGFVTENARNLVNVSKVGPYSDIVFVKTEFGRSYTMKAGGDTAKVRSKLPKTVTVTDEHGNEYDVTGTWTIRNFIPKQPGTYTLEFTPDKSGDAREYLKDTFGLLTARLEVTKAGGCSAAGTGYAAAVALCGGAAAVAVKRRRGEK